jgi:hypothetical protein
MAEYPPFMNAYGSIPKILNKIRDAKTPDRFTQDYLAKTLGFPGGSAKPFIPLAKRLGLLSTDGVPTELYNKFRNTDHTKSAMATAIRQGYADLFSRNENAYKLDKNGLEGLIVQATGLDKGAQTLKCIASTFENLKGFADFTTAIPESDGHDGSETPDSPTTSVIKDFGLNLSYTINLVLPKTDDIAVFNAIFRSLRENLLSK